MKSIKSYPVVLSIAGSDSSGGAGIQADLKTFSALGVYGATAITAVTAQNTVGVHAQCALPPQMVYDQIVAVVDDLHPSVVKIGMLSNSEIVCAVADALGRYALPVVLDPVIVSSSGHRLLSEEAVDVIKEKLLPMSILTTPNIPEMEALTGMQISTDSTKSDAARHLLSYGVKAVLLKGGHEEGAVKRDLLFQTHGDALSVEEFSTETIPTRNIHGTGCTLSSAIAALLARGLGLSEAVAEGKRFITEALRAGADVAIGQGYGPVNHGFNPLKMLTYEAR